VVDHRAGNQAVNGVDYLAQDVTKTFAGIAVLRNVTVHFRPGEVHSLIGENGAGKSTLLKIMAASTPVTAESSYSAARPCRRCPRGTRSGTASTWCRRNRG
jgi:ABC-type branched-subunit amino acid transport system ATPase component